jgi:hypothetical protein
MAGIELADAEKVDFYFFLWTLFPGRGCKVQN